MLWVISGAGLIVSGLVTPLLFRSMLETGSQLPALFNCLFYYLIFLALPVWLAARRTPGLWRSLRPYPISLLSAVSVVALALLAVFFVTDLSALWTVLLEAAGVNASGSSLAVPTTAPGLMLCVFYSAVLPGVCEELVFRGVALPAFERCGTRHAVLASAALFAAMHGSISGLPAHFLLGILLGVLVVCTDSIYAGLIFHTTYNAATIILVSVANRSSAAASAKTGRMLDIIGGPAGVATLLGEMLLMGAMMFFTLRMFRTAARLRGIPFAPHRREPMRAGEWLLLAAGLAIAVLLHALAVLS